jgi:exosortase/archaeosortase family protein
MEIVRWVASLQRRRRTMILVALVTTFAGVGLLIDRPKGTIVEWLALPLLVVGGGLLTLAVWPSTDAAVDSSTSLASRFLRWLTMNGRLVPFFPVLGVALIIADLVYNWVLSATPALQTEDTIVLLAAISLLGYDRVPDRFARERDFLLLFFIWLNVILVVPLLIARLASADLEKSVDVYSWLALAPQTSAVLSALGVNNQLHAVAGSTAPGLTFTPEHLSVQVTVVITTACSGIYSFGIFASAFVAYVLTEYQDLSNRIWLLLGLGFGTAYIANVLRMVIIVLVGYYTDTAETDLQNLLIAHSYAGWLIFLGWIALFWGVILRFVPREPGVRHGDQSVRPPRSESRCAICEMVLSPVVPATRCACGLYYHRTCIRERGRCPACGRPSAQSPSVPT